MSIATEQQAGSTLAEGSPKSFPGRREWRHGMVGELLVVFVAVFAVAFLLSNRAVNLYDEGILLTAVMRTMAGQVLHRDFYYNYGPAQLYLLAGLFKVFGSSVLLERLVGLFAGSFLGVSLYGLARRFCGRSVALATVLCFVLWGIGENFIPSFLLSSVCVLILWSTYLNVVSAQQKVDRRRSFAAGLLVGVLFAFRYDMGVMLVAGHVVAIAVVIYRRARDGERRGRVLGSWLASYVGGFVLVAVPIMTAYLAVAPLHDLLYDIVLYTAKYYRAGRALPPPSIFGPSWNNLAVYLLPVLLGLAVYVGVIGIRRRRSAADAKATEPSVWAEFMLSLALVALLLSVKGLVRISAGAMYACLIPSLLLGAMVYQFRNYLGQHGSNLGRSLRGVLFVTIVLFFVLGFLSLQNTVLVERQQRAIMLKWIIAPVNQAPLPPDRGWCKTSNVITWGMCYSIESDSIATVKYLTEHTNPQDTIYVGLPKHDRIVMNNNLLYFAAQRLPATKWSHFDPFLQNRADIQQEMIGELERNRPPYVVLDGRFQNIHEPNGSSVSTGVHLLDDYIASHYTFVQRYGMLTILKRD
ncbi:MAG TPA: glycosyltransferase family 39 protein [Acidobacteriaceae bacterium]|nr:glycosyltransferase family 39 protein [Acidobacteriaceae bacterium]